MSTWTFNEKDCRLYCSTSGLIFQLDEDEMPSEFGHYFAEALDELDSSGKTPAELARNLETSTQTVAQLQARVAELEAALRIARMALEKIAAAETEVFDADDTREMVTVAMDDEEMQKIAETALREAF